MYGVTRTAHDFVIGYAALGLWNQHVSQAAANRIAFGQQSCATGSVNRRPNVELSQLHPFGRHPIEVWGDDRRVAITTEVAVAHVIDEDHDDVGLPCGRLALGAHSKGKGIPLCHQANARQYARPTVERITDSPQPRLPLQPRAWLSHWPPGQ